MEVNAAPMADTKCQSPCRSDAAQSQMEITSRAPKWCHSQATRATPDMGTVPLGFLEASRI